ncbi:MAG: phage tail tip lysozyme [Deltaproteobacteria bacterium]|nr:phage tail tip lysozyme [Deltaproteobacteria bacterium]
MKGAYQSGATGGATGFGFVSAKERLEAGLFFADLLGSPAVGQAEPVRRRRLRPAPWQEAHEAAETLVQGALTDSEWRSIINCLARGEADVGWPLTADPDRNASLLAARLFCERNALRVDSRREDPLLCVLNDVTINDPRVRALVPHVNARGPLRLWQLVAAADRQRHVMRLLITTYAYPANAAAGLVGNLMAESGVIPSRVEGSTAATPLRARNFANVQTDFTAWDVMNRNAATNVGPRLPGIGLAQWTSAARRAGLFTRHFRNVNLGAQVLFDMDAQVDYLVSELRGAGFAAVQRVLTNPAVTVEQASDEVVYNFEIPGSILSGGAKLPRTAAPVQAVFMQRRALGTQARSFAPAT